MANNYHTAAGFRVELRNIMWRALNQWKGRVFVRGVIIKQYVFINCFSSPQAVVHKIGLSREVADYFALFEIQEDFSKCTHKVWLAKCFVLFCRETFICLVKFKYFENWVLSDFEEVAFYQQRCVFGFFVLLDIIMWILHDENNTWKALDIIGNYSK